MHLAILKGGRKLCHPLARISLGTRKNGTIYGNNRTGAAAHLGESGRRRIGLAAAEEVLVDAQGWIGALPRGPRLSSRSHLSKSNAAPRRHPRRRRLPSYPRAAAGWRPQFCRGRCCLRHSGCVMEIEASMRICGHRHGHRTPS